MKQKTILLFFGTRPEAIKMAPLVSALRKERGFRVRVAVSAQHRHMLDQVLGLFGITADTDLDLMREGQTLFDITSRLLSRFQPVLAKAKPDLVLVHGDTTTTFAGALSAFYLGIPVGHVEAGLRTNDPSRPFPEEINRRLTSSLSALHFAPTPASAKNLLRENIAASKIFVTGNTVIDALLQTAGRPIRIKDKKLSAAVSKALRHGHRLVLMTAHRRENLGRPMENVFSAVLKLAQRFPAVEWLYPVHPNPAVHGPAHRRLGKHPNIHLLPPVDYSDLVATLKASALVITDSGGLQEEAPSLGKPVLVLRDVTERPEATRAGTVRLVGTDKDKIVREAARLLSDPVAYRRMAAATNPYGDGRAAERIREAIRWYFGLRRERPAPFRSGPRNHGR